MDRTPLWFEDRSRLHLIKDTNLGRYCPWTFEMAKGSLLKDYSQQLHSITAFIYTITLSESWRERGVAVAVGVIAQWQSTDSLSQRPWV